MEPVVTDGEGVGEGDEVEALAGGKRRKNSENSRSRSQASRTLKRKVARHAKTERLREQWEAKTEDERAAIKCATVEAKQQVEARLQWGLERGLNVCIDLSYEEEHSEREKRSLFKQLQLSYNVLKRSAVPVHLHVTSLKSLSGALRVFMCSQGLESWKLDTHRDQPWEIFPPDKLVFLSPDAPEALVDFDADAVYVIGGIVDKTVRKAVTLARARELGVRVRRLPIQEHLPARATHILNIDSCVHTICRYLELKDWAQTLLETVPKRRRRGGGEGKERKEAEDETTNEV